LIVSYTSINSAKKAFSKLLELHLKSQTFKICYVFDTLGEKTLLSSICESSDSNKSDKSDEGSDSEKKEPDKSQSREEVKGNSTISQGWSPLQELSSISCASYPDLSLTLPLPPIRRSIHEFVPPQYHSHSHAIKCSEHRPNSTDNDTISDG
jgi:hypothetical protein